MIFPDNCAYTLDLLLSGVVMPNELLAAALGYAQRGWPIFPCVPNGKEPATQHGVLDATTNPNVIKGWWEKNPSYNVGLNVGEAGMMVLDFDQGHPPWAEVNAKLELPGTQLRSMTPRGGDHLFFELSKNEVCPPSASRVAEHVDVRSFNSYVLLPPSKTKDGAYTWGSQGKPAYRSDKLLAEAQAGSREKSANADKWIIEPDLPENIAQAVAWLRSTAKLAVEGQAGDHTTYATAAYMKSCAISEEKAYELMQEHWNGRCSPPWDAEDLQTKIANGYAYNTSQPGNVTRGFKAAVHAQDFKPVARALPAGLEITCGRFRLVDRAGMASIAPPEWLIRDLLPAGSYGILVGAPGSLKTFVALDIALSIASGGSAWGAGTWASDAKSGPVLFAVGEGRSQFSKRVQAWEALHGVSAGTFILADPVPLVSLGEVDVGDLIRGAKEIHDSYSLVVLDTVGRSMAGTNENAQENASAFTLLVERIQRELGAAVLGLHHTGHSATERARGSSVFGADADTVLILERAEKALTVKLTMVKQKDAPEWEKPRYLTLAETLDSLAVASPATPSQIASLPAPQPKTKKPDDPLAELPAEYRPDTSGKLSIPAIVDLTVKVLIDSYPMKFSDRALADKLAMQEGVFLGGDRLRRYLKSWRESGVKKLKNYYDLGQEKWFSKRGP